MNRKLVPSMPALVLAAGLSAVLAASAPLPAQPPATLPTASVENHILQLEERRFAAMMSRDTQALRRILADELTYTHSSGQLETKEQLLESIASGAFQYLAILPEGKPDVRVYGDVAVVTGKGTFRVRAGGEERSLKLRFTDVYVARGDSWQMVAWQSTRLPD
jgi:hypothetical protein